VRNSNILVEVEKLIGRLPSSVEEGVIFLKEYLSSMDEKQYELIDDIDILVEIVAIIKDDHVTTKENPWKRRGRLIPVDEWKGLSDFRRLKLLSQDEGWEVVERKYYYSFLIHQRTFFKIEAVRQVDQDLHSAKIIMPRVIDEEHLNLLLDTYNLNSFRDREWKIIKDVKLNETDAEGRYFFLKELEVFVKEIASRV
jgi:hypothetical protein